MNTNHIQVTKPVKYDKRWGYELCIHNDNGYCGKILHFNKDAKMSLHLHVEKRETWLCYRGFFKLKYINPLNADLKEITIKEGDVVEIPPGNAHQLICLQEGDIFEVSTTHYEYDSYRIAKGDSQIND